MSSQRLQKVIANLGLASRRAAERLIVEGRVRVDGHVCRTLGSRVDPRTATVEVAGHGVLQPDAPVYIMLHKPAHVISTVADPDGRQTVLDWVGRSRAVGPRAFEGLMPRIYPLGRLDYGAEGLLLLTNDGALTHALLHPRRHVPKTYLVRVRGIPNEASLAALRAGVQLRREDGAWERATLPAEARLVKQARQNSWLELTVFEGRNHQVKRMCDAIGHRVSRLVRTHFAGLALDDLPTGAWRFLTAAELAVLRSWPATGDVRARPSAGWHHPRELGRGRGAPQRSRTRP